MYNDILFCESKFKFLSILLVVLLLKGTSNIGTSCIFKHQAALDKIKWALFHCSVVITTKL